MSLHQNTHPNLDEPDCFACRICSVNIGASATPFRREHTVTMARSWEQQMKDDAAYRTLRKNGLQPSRTVGCDRMSKLDDADAIEGKPKLWKDRADILANPGDPMKFKSVEGVVQ